jgi:hypothetical protein
MNVVPETNPEERKLPPKKASYRRITSPRLRDGGHCAEGDQLKQEYYLALEAWRKRSQPQIRPLVEGEAHLVFQLREEALTERNAAANRMYVHRAGCAICRRRR